MNRSVWSLLVLWGVACGVTWALAANGEEIRLMETFYVDGGWRGDAWPWVQIMYDYGRIPGILLGLAGLGLWLGGFVARSWRRYARIGLFLFLLAGLVPGVLVNFVLKDNTGRPRPTNIVAFGGEVEYRAPWELGTAGAHRGFPSGHAGIAFYLMAPYFVLIRRYPGLATVVLVFGIAYGASMGLARMSVGGHFPTDVLWSGVLVYTGGVLLARVIRPAREPDS